MHSGPDAAAVGVMAIAVMCALVFIAIMWAAHVLICYLLWNDYKRIPAQYRKLEPGLVWLLLIPVPLFQLIWNFFVYLRLSDSFKAYFDSTGRQDVGDCGRNLALWYCILVIIPCLNIVALILLILYLVKANDLKNRIPAAAQ
jgi:hypothetical protein